MSKEKKRLSVRDSKKHDEKQHENSAAIHDNEGKNVELEEKKEAINDDENEDDDSRIKELCGQQTKRQKNGRKAKHTESPAAGCLSAGVLDEERSGKGYDEGENGVGGKTKELLILFLRVDDAAIGEEREEKEGMTK